VRALLDLSIAPSTRRKYLALWRRWEIFCRGVGQAPLPAESGVVERFLANLAFDGSKTNFAAAAAAIAWRHSVAGFPTPTKSSRVVALMAGARRMLARPVVRKAPLSIALIRQLVDLSSDSQFLATEQNARLRFQFFILVSFYAFLRYSDFVLLRLRHFRFFDGYMVVCIPHSKCDQYRQGNTVTIAEQSGVASYCAVHAARRYLDLLRCASAVDDTFVLQSVLSGRDGLLSLGSPASRAVLVKQLRCALFSLVPDPLQYSLHSLRSGGATAAACVPSVSREELKRHGRWASSAVDNYIEPSLDFRLNITKKMASLL
jgi:integrase